MATQIILTLCEGPHDVSFITKILKSNNYVSNENLKINQFPSPMSKLMAQEILKTEIEELNLHEVRRSLLPTSTLQKEDAYIFLYSMGGIGKRDARKNILEKLVLTIAVEGEIKKERFSGDNQLSLVYFFDADADGIDEKLKQVNNEITEVFNEISNTLPINNASYVIEKGIKLGCFIFSGDDNNTGKLEDILIPLMQADNEVIFDDASNYLDKHFDDKRLFPLKLATIDNVTTEIRSVKGKDKLKFDKKKSLVSVVGQLQQSGTANTVCIGYTDYLNLNKIQTNQKCQEIVTFFNSLIKS